MIKIAEAGNTENPCFLVIESKGYALSVRHYSEDPDDIDFIAEKNGNKFIAESGPSLLGLIAMWENRGDDWQTRENEDFCIWGNLPENAD